jgi:ubiquinone/menaquinone biosynthesis C-methylase UbiE
VRSERQEEYIIKEFNRSAGSYDDSRLVKSFQRRAQNLVINKMQLQKGMNILDLGCGTGLGTIDIATRLEGAGKVIGLDLSDKMIEQAKKKLIKYKYDNVIFEVESGSYLDYEDYFDYVLSTNAFHHFDKKEEIFSRVYKSLKQKGSYLIQDICNDFFMMKIVDLAGKIGERAHVGSTTSEELKELFVSTGFKKVKVEKKKINWFWGIMIGEGQKLSEEY